MPKGVVNDLRKLGKGLKKNEEAADELLEKIANSDPLAAVVKIAETLEAWQKTDAPELVTKDKEFQGFMKVASRQVATEALAVLRLAVDQLNEKIQTDKLYATPTELAKICGELTRIVAALQKFEEAQPKTPKESELDDEIKRLESSLGISDGKLPDINKPVGSA